MIDGCQHLSQLDQTVLSPITTKALGRRGTEGALCTIISIALASTAFVSVAVYHCICACLSDTTYNRRAPLHKTERHTHRQRHIHTYTCTYTETNWLQLQRIPSPGLCVFVYVHAASCLANVWEQSGPCLAGSVNELFVGRCYARHMQPMGRQAYVQTYTQIYIFIYI